MIYMFLHIGGDVVIPEKNIVAILDIETTTISDETKHFLKVSEETKLIQSISEDLPKTFIVTESEKKYKIYLSPISSMTLMKRSGFLEEISNL